jgi:cytochrome P450
MTTTDASGLPVADLRSIPSARGWPIVGVAPQLLRDPLKLVSAVMREHGELVRLEGLNTYLVADADLVRAIMIDDPQSFSKNPETMKKISPAIGAGLSTLTGAEWSKHRKLANPVFAKRNVSTFMPIFHRSIRETIAEWDASDGQIVDVTAQMKKLTLRIVIRCLFSTDIDAFSHEIMTSLQTLQHYSVYRLWSPLQLPEYVPTPRVRRYKRAKAFMERMVDRIIARRHELGHQGPDDLLSLLMAARDADTGEPLPDEKVRHDIMNMFLAGHETTANAVAFALYLLAGDPAQAERLWREVEPTEDSDLEYEQLLSLSFNSRVFQESLRLYPSSWAMSRVVLQDYRFRGQLLPKGADLLVSQWCLHRNPRYWRDPERFDPDRFLPERLEQVHKFAYIPFGAGGRKCIGVNLAEAEGRMILAMLARRYRFELTSKTSFALVARLFMSAEPGIALRVSRRRPQ